MSNQESIAKTYQEKVQEGLKVLVDTMQESYGRELEENELKALSTIYKFGFDSGFQTGVIVVSEQLESANLGEGNDET